MMFALLLTSRYPDFLAAQQRHEWRRPHDMRDLKALAGQTLGIIGLGHTGLALARRARAFEMHVVAYRRRDLPKPDEVDLVFSAARGDGLEAVLEIADVVTLVLGLSDATHHLINAQRLATMKPSAVLINLSRGGVVDQDALITALRNGTISGAGLDVTTPEPLPADHPLWDAPNVLITPHFTPPLPLAADRPLDMIIDNLGRYREGRQMLNQLVAADLYTGGP
jgi:phosphoglycerate dehydrogenase-like enzyme